MKLTNPIPTGYSIAIQKDSQEYLIAFNGLIEMHSDKLYEVCITDVTLRPSTYSFTKISAQIIDYCEYDVIVEILISNHLKSRSIIIEKDANN
jgi:hypothetical protein